MFKFLTTRERLLNEERKNKMLEARNKELENAILELAEMAAENEVALYEENISNS